MTQFFRDILEWIYGLVGSYGLAVMIFTLLIRTILTPLEISSRKGMRKMALIQPKINALQQKYGKDQAKLQQKQQELMKKEHYNGKGQTYHESDRRGRLPPRKTVADHSCGL